MKARFLLLTVLVAAAAGLSAGLAQTKRNRAAKEFMRDKLELSQRAASITSGWKQADARRRSHEPYS